MHGLSVWQDLNPRSYGYETSALTNRLKVPCLNAN